MSVRESWVYPEHGEPYLKGSRPHEASLSTGVTVLPDLPDFVSPIDGKTYSGRAGLRDHCARHNVVPNAELKGLPTLTSSSDMRTSEQKRQYADNRKQSIINAVYGRK
jgi:hypothetical protein